MIELCTFYAGLWKSVVLDGPMNRVKREVVAPSMRADMYADQNGLCAYCEKQITRTPADFDVDHIIPVKYGGPTCRTNLHLLCVKCHRTKTSAESRSGANVMYPSDSVVLKTYSGFPKVRPHRSQKEKEKKIVLKDNAANGTKPARTRRTTNTTS